MLLPPRGNFADHQIGPSLNQIGARRKLQVGGIEATKTGPDCTR
jgi:hypothetical protein